MKGIRLNLIMWEKKHNLKSKYVAEKIGISSSTYSQIKNGKLTPSIDFAYKFIEAFPNVNVLELMKKFD